MNTTTGNTFVPSQPEIGFSERRNAMPVATTPPIERRQFGNTHLDMSPDARELGTAIDQYKLMHRSRFITYEEMLGIIKSLGYHKTS